MKLKSVIPRALGLFRKSLQARAVLLTVVMSSGALIALGGFLSFSIGGGLYEARLSQVLGSSKQAAVDVQNTFSAASVTDDVALQSLLNSVVPRLESNASDLTRRVALLRTPGQATGMVLQSPISAELDQALIPYELRQKVAKTPGQLVYQSIAIPFAGVTQPGIVVGSSIQVPVAGNYELYLVYDIQGDQDTLDFVQRTLLIGGLILILVIGIVSYFVSNVVVKPVMIAADVSEQIAEGNLDARLDEKGEDATAHLARSFNTMTASLQQQIAKYQSLSEMQQRFVSDVSHELRTPLASIMMSSHLLNSSKARLPKELAERSDALNNQTQRFSKLLDDLLEISRFDAGAIKATMEVNEIAEAVGYAIDEVEEFARQKGSQIRVDIPSESIEVEYDFNRIHRLLLNVLVNAVEHGEGKPIDIRVGHSMNAVAITITDYGIGMTPEQSARVFDRFWRGDPSRARTIGAVELGLPIGGNGLGMAIALEDAQLHNGWLQVWSAKGKGSCFRLTLPKRYDLPFRTSPLPMPADKPLGPIKPRKVKA